MSVLEAYKSRFDAGGWSVFEGAIEESRRQGQNYIFSEHIIRQLFVEDQSLLMDILQSLKVDPETFRITVEQRMKNRPQHSDAGVLLDIEVIEMLKRALGRARALGRPKVSKADMLVALAQEESGALLEIFGGMDIDPFKVAKVISAAVEREQSPETAVILEEGVQQFCRKGDMIRITTGAFAAMSARVAEVDYEKSVLRVNVNVYGRSNVIELSFSDVEKISFD